jgi:hypothetical protein
MKSDKFLNALKRNQAAIILQKSFEFFCVNGIFTAANQAKPMYRLLRSIVWKKNPLISPELSGSIFL